MAIRQISNSNAGGAFLFVVTGEEGVGGAFKIVTIGRYRKVWVGIKEGGKLRENLRVHECKGEGCGEKMGRLDCAHFRKLLTP